MTIFNPVWRVTIAGVQYQTSILENLTITSGRTNIYEQAQAGYVNLEIINLDQSNTDGCCAPATRAGTHLGREAAGEGGPPLRALHEAVAYEGHDEGAHRDLQGRAGQAGRRAGQAGRAGDQVSRAGRRAGDQVGRAGQAGGQAD